MNRLITAWGLLVTLIVPGVTASVQNGQKPRVHILEAGNDRIIFDVIMDSLNIVQKRREDRWVTEIFISGFEYGTDDGPVRVPLTSLVLGIPARVQPELSILAANPTTIELGKIDPGAGSEASPQQQTGFSVPHTDWYPASFAKLTTVGAIRAQWLARIEITPVRYHQATGIGQFARKLRLQLSWNATGTPSRPDNPEAYATERPEFEEFFARTLVNYQSARSWRARHSEKPPLAKYHTPTMDSKFRIYVNSDNIYQVTGLELADAGANLDEIDPRTIRLFTRGQEVPLLIETGRSGKFSADDRIIFWGKFNRGDSSYLSPYTPANVYQMTYGGMPGVRYFEIDGDPGKAEVSSHPAFLRRVHLEQDYVYDRLMTVTDAAADHWFWHTITTNEPKEIILPVAFPATARPFQVQLSFHGATYSDNSPDHHVVARINGTTIGEVTWDGQGSTVLTGKPMAADILKGTGDILTLYLPGDTPAGNIDQVYLNWIEIDYWQKLYAYDQLPFEFNASARNPENVVIIDNCFSDRAYLLTSDGYRITNMRFEQTPAGARMMFRHQGKTDCDYILFNKSQPAHVEKIEPDKPSHLFDHTSQTDYIIISHCDFWDDAGRLARFRQDQGLTVLLVDIQDLYDEFNYGIYDPFAIKRFLTHAYHHYQAPAPLYVLLVGDTSHRFDKQIAREAGNRSFIPTIMAYTQSWGVCSADNQFVAVSGPDFLPDLYIGRLPANTVAEARVMIDKIIRHETQPALDHWRNNICLATGNGSFFEQSSEHLFSTYIPPCYDVERIYTGTQSRYWGNTADLVNVVNQGTVLLNFIGHGGGGVYFDAGLFLLEDVLSLTNADRLPIIFSLTCFIGYFDNPEIPSLGEELLRAKNGGAVAHFGSAGRAWVNGDAYLNNALFEAIFHHGRRRLGQVTTEAKLAMVNLASGYLDHVKNYNLLGDPATQIGLAPEIVRLDLSKTSISMGDSIKINGTIPAATNGVVRVSVYNVEDSLVQVITAGIVNEKFSLIIAISEQDIASFWPHGGDGVIKAYYFNGKSDGIGWACFSVNKPCISSITLIPEQPFHLTPVFVAANVSKLPQPTTRDLDSVYCTWSLDNNKWQNIKMTQQYGSIWHTVTPIRCPERSNVNFKILAVETDHSGKKIVTESEMQTYRVRTRPDLQIVKDNISVTGADKVILQVGVKNNGETPGTAFTITARENRNGKFIEIGASATISSLAAGAVMTATLPWSGNPAGSYQLEFTADAGNRIDEYDELNNSFSKQVILISANRASKIVSPDSIVAIIFPEGTLDRHSFLNFAVSIDTKFSQACDDQGLKAAFQSGTAGCCAYYVSLQDSHHVFLKPATVIMRYDKNDKMTVRAARDNRVKIYQWNSKYQVWSAVTTIVNESEGTVHTSLADHNSILALLQHNDLVPPEIQVQVNGRNLVDGDYVASRPTLLVLARDHAGFDGCRQPISIELDGWKVPATDFTISQTPGSRKQIFVSYAPDLASGQHQLLFQAMDVNGNLAKTEINVIVNDQFFLATLASHPNPFSDETVIAYTLTAEAEEVSIRIFTVSGRLIRTFDCYHQIGYNEITWEGTDQDGREVANGVYYLKVTAIHGGQRTETVQKMARLR